MKIDVLTLFPEIFPGPLGSSIIGRAIEANKIEINAIDLRNYAHDRHKTVDDKPYGGGPGMLMKADVLFEALTDLKKDDTLVILTTPRGEVFNQVRAEKLSLEKHILFVCGHYEGVDQRFIDKFVDLELSIGDYVMTNGNLPAMVMIDALARLIPGVLGKDESSADESFSNGLLEYPQYTRPYEIDGMRVPDVLISGNHAEIAKWRLTQSHELTRSRRPDLYDKLNKNI
jgi:tRNA (guanine37-N1)-methyltransferase